MGALDWYAGMPESLSSLQDRSGHIGVHRFRGTPAEMRQPVLEDSILCLHLGGPKTVRRWRGGRASVHDIEFGSLTIMPARQDNLWLTTGPIDFAHLTLAEPLIDQMRIEDFDGSRPGIPLIDRVGLRDSYVEALFCRLIEEIQNSPDGESLYIESLLVVLATTLIRRYSTSRPREPRPIPTGGLAGWRLRRVTDYMEANLAADIGVAALTEQAGLSRAQFFRAFKQSTGLSPHAYLSARRLDRARELMDETELALDEILRSVGLREGARLSRRFRQRFGTMPRLYLRSKSGGSPPGAAAAK